MLNRTINLALSAATVGILSLTVASSAEAANCSNIEKVSALEDIVGPIGFYSGSHCRTDGNVTVMKISKAFSSDTWIGVACEDTCFVSMESDSNLDLLTVWTAADDGQSATILDDDWSLSGIDGIRVALSAGDDTFLADDPMEHCLDTDVEAGNGDDTISTGCGDDTIDLGNGDDMLFAGLGDDLAYGDDGADMMYLDDGDDTAYGDDGPDVIFGMQGADLIRGNSGGDFLSGRGGDDDIYGGSGNDVIDGGNGSDTIEGGDNNDVIQGGGGHDTIKGKSGRDLLWGGNGSDTINGGNDQYIFDGCFDGESVSHCETNAINSGSVQHIGDLVDDADDSVVDLAQDTYSTLYQTLVDDPNWTAIGNEAAEPWVNLPTATRDSFWAAFGFLTIQDELASAWNWVSDLFS